MTMREGALIGCAALMATAATAVAVPTTFTDEVDGFREFGGTWQPVNESKTGFFSDTDQDGGPLAPEEGDRFFVSRFNGGTFVGISRVFDFTIEPYVTIFAGYDVAVLTGDLFGFPVGSPQFQAFADVNGNGRFDGGEQIPVTRMLDRPTPAPGTFEEWQDETYIGPDTLTFGGDPVVGHRLGFMFRSAQPESVAPDDIYSWAVDDLFLRITETILDDVDNDGTWTKSSDGFWGIAGQASGLDPLVGDNTFNVINTGSFASIDKVFTGKVFEAGTTVQADYAVGDPLNGQFGFFVPNETQDQVTFSLFADVNGNGLFDPADGETIARNAPPFFPDPTRPTPLDGFSAWTDTFVIRDGLMTFGGDPVIGAEIGWVFRGRMPSGGSPPYAWAVDDLRLTFNTIEEADSVVLAAWDAVENRDDTGGDQNNGDKTDDSTPDILEPGILAQLGGPGGGGNLQGGFEVRSGPRSNDLDFGNLSMPATPNVPNSSLVRTNNDSQRRLDMDITNTSAFPLRLDRVHFDYARLFEPGPRLLSLFMRTLGGDLDLVGFPVVFVTENTFVLGTGQGDYADVDADLSVLPDNILAPGETAAFRWQVDNADNPQSNLAIDNVAVTGVFSDCESDFGLPFLVHDFFDAAAYQQGVADGRAFTDLAAPFGPIDGSDVTTFLNFLANCP